MVDQLESIVAILVKSMSASARVEESILVDVLHHPHRLRGINKDIDQSTFLSKLVSHIRCKEDDSESVDKQLRLEVLSVLNRMLNPEHYAGDDRTLRLALLRAFFDEDALSDPSFHLKPTDTLEVSEEVQNLLDSSGASVLVIELIMVSEHTHTFYQV